MIDPSKDKFAYFKDNIQTAEDKEFDASQYYYHREDLGPGKPGSLPSAAASAAAAAAAAAGLGLSPYGMNAGLGVAGIGGGMGGILGVGDGNAQPSAFSMGFPGSGMLGSGASAFMGTAAPPPRPPPLSGGLPPAATHELHRMSSSEHLSAMMKSRNFPLQPESKAPDMSEFPALSRTNSWALDQGSDTSSTRSQSSEFVIQKEDFPALSPFASAPNSSDKATMLQHQQDHLQGSSIELKRHASFHSSANDSMASQRPSGPGGNTTIGSRAPLGMGGAGFHLNGPSATSASAGSLSGSFGGGGGGGSLPHGGAGRHAPPGSANASSGELDPSNQFGLLGMLHSVIRPSNDAKKNLLMGCDLTSLGLNLNSAEPLYPIFASPWADGPLTKEPQFTLPMCYYNQPPALKTTHLAKFHLETLFYIFYSMPKDVLQAYAAQELYSRDWRYHTELKMWLKRATPADSALFANGSSPGSSSSSSMQLGGLGGLGLAGSGSGNGSGSGMGPSTPSSLSSGSGSIGSIGSASSASVASSAGLAGLGPQFLFFDTASWERRVFTGSIHSLSAGLLSEDEIRVKFNAAS